MEALHIIAVRLAPAFASGLVTLGVANGHAEVIALGALTALAVGVEAIIKWRAKREAK